MIFDYSRYDKVNYGCGFDKREGYLNVDTDAACIPDVLIPVGDLSSLPKRHFSEVYANDVLEHIPRVKTLDALLEFASLLKLSGALIIQVPSVTHVIKKMHENPLFADQYGWTICLFGNQAHSGDFHHTGFTDTYLTVHLAAAGFDVTKRELRDEWLLRFECRKTSSWDDLLEAKVDDLEFLMQAYNIFFKRVLDDTGRIHFGGQLKNGVARREILKTIASAPERLFVVARQLGM